MLVGSKSSSFEPLGVVHAFGRNRTLVSVSGSGLSRPCGRHEHKYDRGPTVFILPKIFWRCGASTLRRVRNEHGVAADLLTVAEESAAHRSVGAASAIRNGYHIEPLVVITSLAIGSKIQPPPIRCNAWMQIDLR